MRKITLTKNKFQLTDDIEEINEGTIKPIGNGAMIISNKKHIGKKAYIIITKN